MPGLRLWLTPYGDRRWDRFLRATAVTALVGIPIVILFPRLVPLVWLAVVSIPANSPLSPILPTAFEPLIMEAAKYERAIWVTLVALGSYLYMEYLNWYAYAWILNWDRFAPLRSRSWVRRSVDHFARRPWATTAFFAFTPLPFWVVRCLAILHRYPVRSFLTATALGRFPRLFAYAWVGELLQVPSVILLLIIIIGAAAVVVIRLARGQRVLADTVLDTAAGVPAPASQPPSDRLEATTG